MITPVEVTVAIAVLPEDQVPPEVVSVNVVEAAGHIAAEPETAPGAAGGATTVKLTVEVFDVLP